MLLLDMTIETSAADEEESKHDSDESQDFLTDDERRQCVQGGWTEIRDEVDRCYKQVLNHKDFYDRVESPRVLLQ
jgi:hypothetical protein